MWIYEWVSALAFVAVLVWLVRARDTMGLGALLAGFLLFGFDWLWCGRSFFNVTVADGLTMLPGLDIQGQRYPIALAFNWSVGFGFVPYLLSSQHARWSRALGLWHYPVVLAAGALIDMAAEIPLVSGLGVYDYHQAESFLIGGVPWSNLWFGGNLLALGYFGLAYARKWAALPARGGFALNQENTWKGFALAAAGLWAPFYLCTVLQFFWYSAAAPWVESGRLF